MSDLIEPKEITLHDMKGNERFYTLSKIPYMQGREILTQFPISAIPKIGDYKINEDLSAKLMSFIAVKLDNGSLQVLKTRALIDNHVPDVPLGLRLEAMMIEYNCGFFTSGTGSTFLDRIMEIATQWALKTSTALREQSSQKAAPPSTNSEPSTP